MGRAALFDVTHKHQATKTFVCTSGVEPSNTMAPMFMTP